DWRVERGVELIVKAGWDRIDDLHRRLPCINIHPSLLPAFGGGMDAVKQALDHGVKVTGATVHVVTDDLDAGPILAQESVIVLEGDNEETLLQRIHQAEYRIVPEAIRLMEQRLASAS